MILRILYLAFTGTKIDGVAKKILSQFSALKKINSENKLIIITNEKPKIDYEKEIKSLGGKVVWPSRKALFKLDQRKNKFSIIMNELKNIDPSDTVIYFRYPIADIFFLRFLRKISDFKIVTEHQQIENTRQILMDSPLKFISEQIFGKLVRKKIDAFVCVSKEILKYQYERGNMNKKEGIVIGNGIDVASVPVKRYLPIENKIELLFVGSVYKPHGLDRIIEALKRKNMYNKFNLHILGEGPETAYLKKKVLKYKLKRIVNFYGYKTSKEMNNFFDHCHIAIGSLAIHRAGSGSPLKSREYCARGIPFVDSVNDPDFSPDFPYRLKIDSNESPIDLERIENFAKNVLSDKEHPMKMREYAKEKLDWSIKMQKLANFLEKIFNEKKSS